MVTEATQAAILDALRAGATRKDAAAASGIHSQSLYRLISRASVFREAVEQAEREAPTMHVTATCNGCGKDFTYERTGKGRGRDYCDDCRTGDRGRTDKLRASRPAPRCKNCGKDINSGYTGGRRKGTYCSDRCREQHRSDQLKAERVASMAGRVCAACGKPVPSSRRANAVTCSALCSERYSNRLRPRRTKLDPEVRTRSPCPVCGGAIAPERHRNTVYCSTRCRRTAVGAKNRSKNADYQRNYRYRITSEEYRTLLRSQQGRCAVCGTDTPGGAGGWHVDHDHEGGDVRGLLCHHCNVGLGYFGDDFERVQAAAEYLRAHKHDRH
jgi:predicted nucleic acid-binding Zn ribbon protein